MHYSKHGWFREQFGFLRRQFLQEGELPFTNVLPGSCCSVSPSDADLGHWAGVAGPVFRLLRLRNAEIPGSCKITPRPLPVPCAWSYGWRMRAVLRIRELAKEIRHVPQTSNKTSSHIHS